MSTLTCRLSESDSDDDTEVAGVGGPHPRDSSTSSMGTNQGWPHQGHRYSTARFMDRVVGEADGHLEGGARSSAARAAAGSGPTTLQEERDGVVGIPAQDRTRDLDQASQAALELANLFMKLACGPTMLIVGCAHTEIRAGGWGRRHACVVAVCQSGVGCL